MLQKPIEAKEKDPQQRILGFEEVVLGYSEEEALKEAKRCLQCKNPTCINGCPVGIDIKSFIEFIVQKNYNSGYMKIREKNNFPSICGRVCPAEFQCRKACVLTKKGSIVASGNAINIHLLERFLGQFGMDNNIDVSFEKDKTLEKYKVAVVGSGPAGLSVAGELARAGIKVVIFESLHKSGGVLRYGIPPFRLPEEVLDFEINYLKKLGVEIITNVVVGNSKSLPDLFKEGFSAVFLGLGAGVPYFLNIKGENLCNVYSANEFLTRVNLMSAYKFPQYHTPVNIGQKVVVIGGGNTAMDAARVALRLQKMNNIQTDVTVIYRRTESEMPARTLEIAHAKEEGIKFDFLISPKEFLSDEKGAVKNVLAYHCRLEGKDSSGRPRPVIIESSEFSYDCDMVIIAVGLGANRLLTNVTPNISTDDYGDIIVDENMQTSFKKVFAGGDIVGGEGTVIEAMGMAKKAAISIINQLKSISA